MSCITEQGRMDTLEHWALALITWEWNSTSTFEMENYYSSPLPVFKYENKYCVPLTVTENKFYKL